MNIGLVIRDFDPRRGGAEHWTWQFAAALAAARRRVFILAERFSPQSAALGATLHQLPPARSAWDFAEKAAAAARKLPLDIVHDMGQGWHCDLFQPHGGSRRASMEHNLLLWPRPLRAFKRSFTAFWPRYRELQAIAARQYAAPGRLYVALSQMVAEHFVRWHGVAREQIRLVYNGVDVERFSPARCAPHREHLRRQLDLRPQEVLLLIVAHNLKLKGVPTLLRALAHLRREGHAAKLAVVGGTRTGGCRRLARRLGVAEQVAFLGARADVLPYYAAADLYVQPTFYDPCSLVVLEALACGLPVVTSRYNGAGELLQPGVHGEVISDPADDAELAAALAPLLDRDRLHAMRGPVRALAERHTFAHNVERIAAIYEELAARRRAAA